MEAEDDNIGMNSDQNEPNTDGGITVTTIKTDYLKEPITITSFQPRNVVAQEATLEEEGREEHGGGTLSYGGKDQEDDGSDGEKNVTPRGAMKKGRYYIQRFRKEWLKHPDFKDWLGKGNSESKARCMICETELVAGKSELVRHNRGKKHQKKVAAATGRSIDIPKSSGKRGKSSESHDPTESIEFESILDDNGISHVLHIVDLRSDTVTQPCPEMKKAMMNAALGDDAFSEDPTVKTLEEKVAMLLEKEAALYVPSGTMANLICVMAHCWQRGSEVVVGDQSHLYLSSQGGMAQVGGVHHRTLKNLPDGTFSLEELQALVRGNDLHWSALTLVCVENTHNMMGGKALPIQWMDDLGTVCSGLGLMVHCDGARLMNAAVALGTSPARLAQNCDSVTLCLNKGLGAPMGSVITGTREFITRAMRVRKTLGGHLHQTGMPAAAGLWALDHRVPKLSVDHAHARAIAQGVQEQHSSAVTVDLKSVQSNIVLLNCDNIRVDAKKLCQRLASVTDAESQELGEQVVVMMMPMSDTCVRLMTHCNVKKDDVKAVIKKLQYIIQEYDNMMYLEYKING
ncbi:uncharacterized protein LOC127006804 isoform X1 [Eriocheir sinensis]|uniref:uncharacterized protein LOC127006804 isoform X1 n=2 Tax=Eriocheir sinensis TaxID=95602 RepID=UPI0021CA5974|nr:uncharacterized protein LOC127006804 isoform X1 [Eriocheir sinensis]